MAPGGWGIRAMARIGEQGMLPRNKEWRELVNKECFRNVLFVAGGFVHG
jgi:hypothetical protein